MTEIACTTLGSLRRAVRAAESLVGPNGYHVRVRGTFDVLPDQHSDTTTVIGMGGRGCRATVPVRGYPRVSVDGHECRSIGPDAGGEWRVVFAPGIYEVGD